MAMDFGLLALKARTSPILNIIVDVWPRVSTDHGVLCGTNAKEWRSRRWFTGNSVGRKDVEYL